MFGALIGYLVGSVYEWNNYKAKDFQPLIHPRAFLTDDSMLTFAVADAFVNKLGLVESFKEWGHRYPDSDWGGRFTRWLFSDQAEPYGSFCNGSAMRVSPVALLIEDLDELLELARRSAVVTHDHPEGIKGAEATAMAIHYARQEFAPEDIRSLVADFSGYDLDRCLDDIRPGYRFDVTCQGSVPEALI